MTTKRSAAVVFVHGLARKPPEADLLAIWLQALAGDGPRPDVFPLPNPGLKLSALGYPAILNYWADVFYGSDYETDFTSYYENSNEISYEAGASLELQAEGLTSLADGMGQRTALTPREVRLVRQLEAEISSQLKLIPEGPMVAPQTVLVGGESFEIASWLPRAVKEAIIKNAAMEAYYFLFDKTFVGADGKSFQTRKELRMRLLRDLAAAAAQAEKVVVVAHSMGTMIAYDVLRNCPECVEVDTLITCGSPLGVTEVQDELKAIDASDIDFPAAKLKRWVNIYDPLDPVCGVDPRLGDDFAPAEGKSVLDQQESNWGSWRHTITHYLSGKLLRQNLLSAVTVPAR